MLVDVTSVKVLDNHSLELTFEDGYHGVFNMQPYFTQKPFDQLTNPDLFRTAQIGYGTIIWDGGRIDIAPEEARQQTKPITQLQR